MILTFTSKTISILNLSVNFLCTSLQYFLFLSFEYSFLWYFFTFYEAHAKQRINTVASIQA